MKYLPVAAALAGLAATALLVAYFGLDAVLGALAAIGWAGFVAVTLIHLALIAIMGLAWHALLPGTRAGVFMWGRLVRDAGSDVLPLSQVGGYVLGARAVSLAGVPGTLAAASTIVDATLEFLAQLAYTALGLAWFVELRPGTPLALPIAIGLGVAVLASIGLFLAQRRSGHLLDRLARLLGRSWAERGIAGAAALNQALGAIWRRCAGLATGFALHFVCWIASGAEIWLALRFAKAPLGFGIVLVMESVLFAVRTLSFAIPNAVGVQEGAYILVGASFGLTPEMALALSLLKRARDLAIGLPAIAAWQGIEGGRLWRRRAARPIDASAAEAAARGAPRD